MARDSEDDRLKHRASRSRSRSYSTSQRHKYKKSSHRRKHSSSRSRSNSKSRNYSRHKYRKRHRSYSRSRSSSRDRSRRKRSKKYKRRRHSSTSDSSYSDRGKSHSGRSSRDRDRFKRSMSSDRKGRVSKQRQDEFTLTAITTSCDIKDLTESEKLDREKALESIANDSFVQQSFVSSKKSKNENNVVQPVPKDEFNFGTKAELLSKKVDLGEGSLFSPHLFGDPEEREEKYIKRIFTLRQKLLLEGTCSS